MKRIFFLGFLGFLSIQSFAFGCASTTGPEADAGPRDSSTIDSGGDADPGTDGGDPGTRRCSNDDDCRAYANNCGACKCIPLRADEVDPVCNGDIVACILNPCQNKKAACQSGTCTIIATQP